MEYEADERPSADETRAWLEVRAYLVDDSTQWILRPPVRTVVWNVCSPEANVVYVAWTCLQVGFTQCECCSRRSIVLKNTW